MNTEKRVYLDYHSTTPVDPRVREAMIPYFTDKFGNAASRNHSFGWEAEEAVDRSRRTIADELNAKSKEIVFTSGATESINLAIKGLCETYERKGKHIVTQMTEHKAVLDTCEVMKRRGWEVDCLPVEKEGRVDPNRVNDAIRDETVLVSIMHANNEIGTLNPISEIGKICRDHNVFFFVDAAQSFGKLPIDIEELGIDLLAASGHKIYGPKGIGFLYVRGRHPRVNLSSQIDGGGHERGMRSGTLAVPLIVGMSMAAKVSKSERDEENRRSKTLRDRLMEGILESLPGTVVNGSMEYRLPHNLNVAFPEVEAESLLMGMGDIACSTGSACTSATLEPSHVIKALGVSEEMAHSSVRFSVGRFTTEEDIDYAITKITATVEKLRQVVPHWQN
ncbi:MAG: IscS subfamily cysteine desulfurase [Candidatus Neomarinimicrobiota bacterium]